MQPIGINNYIRAGEREFFVLRLLQISIYWMEIVGKYKLLFLSFPQSSLFLFIYSFFYSTNLVKEYLICEKIFFFLKLYYIQYIYRAVLHTDNNLFSIKVLPLWITTGCSLARLIIEPSTYLCNVYLYYFQLIKTCNEETCITYNFFLSSLQIKIV